MSITGYSVVTDEVSTATSGEATGGKTAGAADRSITITKLNADTQYYFRVYAKNGVGTSGVGVPAGERTDKADRPAAPTALVALQADADDPSAGDINLYWLEPASNGGRPITGYVIEYKVNSLLWQSLPDLSNEDDPNADNYPTANAAAPDYVHVTDTIMVPAPTADDPDAERGLDQGDMIRYRVYAKHVDNTSRASVETRLTLIDTGDVAVDGAPVPNTVDERPEEMGVLTVLEGPERGSIQISWTNALETGYRIDVSEDGMVWEGLESTTNLKVEALADSVRRYIHVGLTPGATRYYRVFASDAGPLGIPSISGVGTAGDAEPPAASSAFTATPMSATQINLAWTAPTETGLRPVRRYLLEISDSPLTDTEITLGNVADALATGTTTGMIWVSGTSYSHKGLEPDTRYYYRLRSDHSAANGDPVPALTIVDDGDVITTLGTITPRNDAAQQTAATHEQAAPGVPHSLSAHQGIKTSSGDRTDQGVYLTWLKDNSGGPIEEYEVERAVTGEDTIVDTIVDNRTFYNDYDSQASLDDKERRYRVRAVSIVGKTGWTDWVTYPLAEHTAHVPPAALAVTESDGAADTATITWQAISGATSYHVAVITDDGNYTLVSDTYMEITDVMDREHMFTGLTSGTAYIFAVIGEMADGTYSGLAFQKMTLQ